MSLTGPLQIVNIRSYPTGLVVQVTDAINPDCAFADHLQLFSDTPNYSASASLFLSAWSNGKQIRAYYKGCGQDGAASANSNVHVLGWQVAP